MNKFKEGQIVVCILNNRATLTVGKEYIIIGTYGNDEYEEIGVENDDGYTTYYTNSRFIDKSEFRNHIINEVLK